MLQATGREAETFETTVRRYASIPAGQRAIRSRLGAFAQLLKIIATPALDLDRLARTMLLPVVPNPHLSIDDERWLAEHHPAADDRSPSLA